jgi:uncharacterized protein (TIGR00288 family)
MSSPQDGTQTMAVFCDFENLAIGVREANDAKFDITKVIERLLLKGSIVVKKAYSDWDRYKEYKRVIHEAAFDMIEIPHVRQSGKNSADIRMVVDALDLCYTRPHIGCFVIISGDSDFSPLVSKLRENNKIVIGVGVKRSTSDIFINNCDEFIFYDDLVREKAKAARKPARSSASASATASRPKPEAVPEEEKKSGGDPEQAIELVVDTLDALSAERGDTDTIWGSMIKDAIKRRQPQFSERFHGFKTFGALLEAAKKRGLIAIRRDEKSGNYQVTPIETA